MYDHCIMTTKFQGWIYLALARGYAGGGVGYFHDKAKNIRDKMSNLSNKTMISKLFVNNNYNTVVKQDFAVVK